MSTDKERAKAIELAEKFVKRGKLQEAISEYRKLISGSAQDVNFRSIISDLYLRQNQKAKAVEELKQIASFYDERGLYSQSMAIYKKINKLAPENTDSAMKLADLYFSQGFLSEAKAEYLKIANELKKSNHLKPAISLYEKVLKLDKRDIQIKLTLADLYKREGLTDQAIDLLNEVAEFKMRNNALKEAREALNQAVILKEDHPRTLTILIDLLKKENKKKEALVLIDDILKKDSNNAKVLRILGNFYFEDQDFGKAKEIFSKILSLRPKDIEARVKLGRIDILKDNLDHAYELFDPLIEVLIKKEKASRAIGLLGLILSAKKAHLPTLERLVSIYKLSDQKENLEIASRVLLREYYKKNMRKESLPIISGLIEFCPEDEELKREYNLLGEEFGFPQEKKKIEEPAEEVKEGEEAPEEAKEVKEVAEEERKAEEFLEEKEEAKKPPAKEEEARISVEEHLEESKPEVQPEEKKKLEVTVEEKREAEELLEEEREAEKPSDFEDVPLEVNLAQADLYIEQGLIRNAKRILENLRIYYPNDPRIDEKIAAIKDAVPAIKQEEILQRLEKVSKRETNLFRKKEDTAEEKGRLTPADIFQDTDISPEDFRGHEKKRYYDSTERIDDELKAIKAIFNLQLKGNPRAVEKDLAEIVAEFRMNVKKNVSKDDYESHFNLGVAFLEQDLIDEAVEEFKIALKDEARSLECFSFISGCYRKKKDLKEAASWMEKALNLSEKDSDQFFAFKYELASCFEEMKEAEKALALYDEIKKWDSEYRDVAERIKTLSKRL